MKNGTLFTIKWWNLWNTVSDLSSCNDKWKFLAEQTHHYFPEIWSGKICLWSEYQKHRFFHTLHQVLWSRHCSQRVFVCYAAGNSSNSYFLIFLVFCGGCFYCFNSPWRNPGHYKEQINIDMLYVQRISTVEGQVYLND